MLYGVWLIVKKVFGICFDFEENENINTMDYFRIFDKICSKDEPWSIFNRSSRRKRSMASNPIFIIPDFFCIFQMNFPMATLGLKEMGTKGKEQI
jgi:hypothetical protein